MPIYRIKSLEVGPIADDQPINVRNAKIAVLALIAEKTGAVIKGDDIIESAKLI